MTLAEELSEYVRACFSCLWIETHEPDEAIAEIRRLCAGENWRRYGESQPSRPLNPLSKAQMCSSPSHPALLLLRVCPFPPL